MAASVYIESSVPSAYVTPRTDSASRHRRDSTIEWWDQQRPAYELWSSDTTIAELREGQWPGQQQALSLIADLPRLSVTDEVVAVARRYVRERVVPADLGGDAMHLAAACVHEMDFLLTWNIRHLANPNKLDHLTVINRRLSLLTPRIVTPEMLWKEDF
ncbi:MAG: type II toxin-antitoxin system VapC family toxin [Phycisphaerales bacterium]|nr:type II toxin-antitoxin system VapC family toxin [Phycisphaerales bacterium]